MAQRREEEVAKVEDAAVRLQREADAFDSAVAGVVTQFETTVMPVRGAVQPADLDEMSDTWRSLATTHDRYAHQIDGLSTAIVGGLQAEPTVEPLARAGIEATLKTQGVTDRGALRLLELMVLARHAHQRVPYTQDAEAIVAGLARHGAGGAAVTPDRFTVPMLVGRTLRGEFNPANFSPVRRRRVQG
jgi:hypothetical protein